jgi:hypothetical protein
MRFIRQSRDLKLSAGLARVRRAAWPRQIADFAHVLGGIGVLNGEPTRSSNALKKVLL